MFTGIITETTEIEVIKRRSSGLVISFKKPRLWTDLELGESININGVCLTISAIGRANFTAELMAETLNKTTFGNSPPAKVNLERALRAGDRLGGHWVQGHVDCVGKIVKITKNGGLWLDIAFPTHYRHLVADKGSIAIDGVSLTVAKLKDSQLSVSLVDYTIKHTTLGELQTGDNVNIEFDMIAKHIAQIIKR